MSPAAAVPEVWLNERPFAHRGLHDGGDGVVENSSTAFMAAIDAGYGIELDVQLSRDGEAVVFHDETLERLTGESGPVRGRTVAELAAIPLTGCSDTITTLAGTLGLIGGRAPLLIEIKSKARGTGPLEAAVARALAGYSGAAAVMSFNPFCARWFRNRAPQVTRGLVASARLRETGSRFFSLLPTMCGALAISHAQFVAYDIRALPNRHTALVRRRGLPLLSWTVRSAQLKTHAAAHVDNIIFERIRPVAGDWRHE